MGKHFGQFNIKKLLGLEKTVNKGKPTEFSIGVSNNKIVLNFGESVQSLELDRIQALDLLTALSFNITLIKK